MKVAHFTMVRSHIRLEDPLKQTYRYNQVVMF